jgi:hypothetical protein
MSMLDRIKNLADFELDKNNVCAHWTPERAICRNCADADANRKLLAQVARDFTKLAPLLDDWADEAVQSSTMSKNDDALFELWVDIRDRMTVAIRKPERSGYTGCTCKAGYDNNCIVHGGDEG